jgi:hypothetical protein
VTKIARWGCRVLNGGWQVFERGSLGNVICLPADMESMAREITVNLNRIEREKEEEEAKS